MTQGRSSHSGAVALIQRNRLLLVVAVTALCVLGIATVLGNATPVPDPEMDAAVATALQAGQAHGDAHPRIASTLRGDADTLRQSGTDVGVTVKGAVLSVTITGTFNADQVPPGGDPATARGKYHRMILFFQNGRVIGGASYVN